MAPAPARLRGVQRRATWRNHTQGRGVDLLCTISITLIIDNTRFIFDNRVVLLYIKKFRLVGKI